jgi:ADP-ribosyl-[dinitrogen reductase] hydrolase
VATVPGAGISPTDDVNAERAVGALVGSVVGDALGAPFEFDPPAAFSKRFPRPVLLDPGEMPGGRGWAPAEWTDDSQMGLLVARSLLDRGGVDEADLFDRFVAWNDGGPRDVGIQTREVLGSGLGWSEAAAAQYARTGHAAGNGSLMRTTPAAVFLAGQGSQSSADGARRISGLTHGDPAAGDGCAIFHELVRVALSGGDPLDAVGYALETVPVDRREKWEWRLGARYRPDLDSMSNGAVWPTLATAVWAVRTTTSFEGALRAAVDVGHDTDTVACVTGGLAGAVYSIGAIPSRWTTYLHGELTGRGDSGLDLAELETLAQSLAAGGPSVAHPPPAEHLVEPMLVSVDQAIYAASYPGVAAACAGGRLPAGALVLSLSRTFGALDSHRPRRQLWMVDQDKPGTNLAIGRVLDDAVASMDAALEAGRAVVVHCHGGRSRTGLVLRAQLLAHDPAMTVEEAGRQIAGRWPHLDLWNRSFTAALTEWVDRRRRSAPPG